MNSEDELYHLLEEVILLMKYEKLLIKYNVYLKKSKKDDKDQEKIPQVILHGCKSISCISRL